MPPGFYLLTAKTSDDDTVNSHGQVVIQISDLAVQVIADEEKSLVWVNEMQTGRAAKAKIFDPVSQKISESTDYGIAVIERELSSGEYFFVDTDENSAVVFIHAHGFQHFWSPWWGGYDYAVEYDIMPSPRMGGYWNPWQSQNANNKYWSAVQLDRTLFQRSDTVSLWGFVQNRAVLENISHVTAKLTEQSWWRWGGENETLHTQNFSVANGAYFGEIKLPNVDPGSYELAIYHGDVLLNSIFFSVMDYVKPPYQLNVSANKKAIFAGEEIKFSARTEFFEGTPVPDLEISYHAGGSHLNTKGSGRGKTNQDGVIEITEKPTAINASVQGQRSLYFSAEATLPEIGWTHEGASVRVFINDINVKPRASREKKDATISVDVHKITLDRLNDGTEEHWGDFLGAPRENQNLSVEIFEIWWEKIRDGEFYDHITRQVVPRFRHEQRENKIETFSLVTDSNGHAQKNFSVPDTEKRTYEARITTTDGNGRTIKHNVFIGKDWSRFYNSANENRIFLFGANDDGYDIGDDVELTIMRGAEAVEQGNFLFVVVQGEILSYHIGKNPLEIKFGEQHVPNAQVFAYHFNGHTYNSGGQMSQRLRYNPSQRELEIKISLDKEFYRPGETPTIKIKTTDKNGSAKSANVNISLVDEALFALMDYQVDTLEMLYRNISDDLKVSLATHLTFVSDGIDDMVAENEQSDGLMNFSARAQSNAVPGAPVAMEAAVSADSGGGGNETRIRERFEDTAMFVSVRTDANGEATIALPLPDNVTSWRATASAITNDLFAGNKIENIRVTLPMFLHYTLNKTFLTGDVPTLGVNAYGTNLTGGEEILFEVWREDFENDVRKATGKSYERVDIPLWEMNEEGHGALIIRAVVASENTPRGENSALSDAVRHEYQVVNSHRLVDTTIFYEVTTSTVFDVNAGGLTNITFTDKGRGQFLGNLFWLKNIWWSGARLEALIAKREANSMIKKYFPDVKIFGEAGNFDVSDYQTQDGGIAILPYANAELDVTVMMLPFVKDEINLINARRYLRNIFETSATDNKMLALYGLAILNEPVLLELQNYAKLENLSARNTAYVALAFAELGEIQIAKNLYDSRIKNKIENIAPFYRVNDGTNLLQILDATSVAALLAAKIGAPEAMGLHNYTTTNRGSDVHPRDGNRHDNLLYNIERLKFISHEIKNHTDSAASITYNLFGETVTREFKNGGQFTLRIPAQNFHEFKLTSVTGEVGAVSVVRTPLEDMNTVNNELKIRREFFRGTSNTASKNFEQDEIIRVQISVDYGARDLSGTYVITDFLPAGLVHVANSARFERRNSGVSGWHAFAKTEGARITFYDYNGRFSRNHTYFYYARVINPGTFRAEGTLVQSMGAREFMVVGDDDVITVK
ncbi:MAG: hypothetical protein FWD19_02630 [Defluviitaleaceae bacterium]|nr:hypothetical protein [Defluviitaleaceae bacterium]